MEMMDVKLFYAVCVIYIVLITLVVLIHFERTRKFLNAQREKSCAYAEELERALALMWFAYVNKDEECPHGYELTAIQRAEELLGPWEECMPDLLKVRNDNEQDR